MNREKLFTITQAARLLGMGRNKLMELMRNNGLLHSHEPMRNSPTKYATTQGLLVAQNAQYKRGPVAVPYINTKVTSNGMVWMRDLIEKQTVPEAS
ncbi:phage antirepressor KilAC domain-containing protein [Microbulbifer sp. EKSA005]|uniref:phage antirepressor KilAC domain-containing protein n=1 Tax=Microbulbifer sp. EKSA005 TaxID=3243364 RepID=UPI004040FFE0